LDLSYNEIRSAAPLQGLAAAAGASLKELYLANNKITGLTLEQEGAAAAAADGADDDADADDNAAAATTTTTTSALRSLTALTVLELGSNRIRRVEGLEDQRELRELWLGRNRVGPSIGPGLSHLALLRRVSLQSNRLESMLGLEGCVALEELYLSHNGIRALEGLRSLTKLRVLDVSSNRLERIRGGVLDAQTQLEDLWLNDNAIDDFSKLNEELKSCRKTLQTVYLDGNPAALRWKAERRYRRELVGRGGEGGGDDGGPLLPALEQLDSDVLPEPGAKRDAWVAAESSSGGAGRATGPEADLAAVREAAAAAAARRAARAAQEAAEAAAAAGAGGGDDAPPRGGSG
jgi:protein phosphatase 1 regulatory subunit 7